MTSDTTITETVAIAINALRDDPTHELAKVISAMCDDNGIHEEEFIYQWRTDEEEIKYAGTLRVEDNCFKPLIRYIVKKFGMEAKPKTKADVDAYHKLFVDNYTLSYTQGYS